MLRIIGHRGAKGLAPENTLTGLRKALEHKVDEIEIDARVTSDGVAVVYHNQYLTDPSGHRLDIRKNTYDDLRLHRPDMPTLLEAIKTVDRTVPLQIEVKWGERTAPITAVLRQCLQNGWQPEHFKFGSKNQRTLKALHQAIPEVPIVIIEPFLSVRAVLRGRQLGSKTLSMNELGLWPGFIRAMHRRGYTLYSYTINNRTKALRWEKHGLAGVVTDVPDIFES